MATRSLIPRLTDIVESIERIRDVLREMPLELFELIGKNSGSSSAGLRLFPRPAGTSQKS